MYINTKCLIFWDAPFWAENELKGVIFATDVTKSVAKML